MNIQLKEAIEQALDSCTIDDGSRPALNYAVSNIVDYVQTFIAATKAPEIQEISAEGYYAAQKILTDTYWLGHSEFKDAFDAAILATGSK